MSTSRLRALQIPLVWPSTGLARVCSVIVTMLDAFEEAQQQARAAHARYPFTEW